VLVIIIFLDLIGKLYNDYTTKQEIENKMQKEATKDVSSVAHD